MEKKDWRSDRSFGNEVFRKIRENSPGSYGESKKGESETVCGLVDRNRQFVRINRIPEEKSK